MEKQFIEGFIKQCEALGVDPESVVVEAGLVRSQLDTDKSASVHDRYAEALEKLAIEALSGEPVVRSPEPEAPFDPAKQRVRSWGRAAKKKFPRVGAAVEEGSGLVNDIKQGIKDTASNVRRKIKNVVSGSSSKRPSNTFRQAQNAFTGRPEPISTTPTPETPAVIPESAPVATQPARTFSSARNAFTGRPEVSAPVAPAAAESTEAAAATTGRFAGLRTLLGRAAASPAGRFAGGTLRFLGSAPGLAAQLLAAPVAGAAGGFYGAAKGHGLEEAVRGFKDENPMNTPMAALGKLTSGGYRSNSAADEAATAGAAARARRLRQGTPVASAPTAQTPRTPFNVVPALQAPADNYVNDAERSMLNMRRKHASSISGILAKIEKRAEATTWEELSRMRQGLPLDHGQSEADRSRVVGPRTGQSLVEQHQRLNRPNSSWYNRGSTDAYGNVLDSASPELGRDLDSFRNQIKNIRHSYPNVSFDTRGSQERPAAQPRIGAPRFTGEPRDAAEANARAQAIYDYDRPESEAQRRDTAHTERVRAGLAKPTQSNLGPAPKFTGEPRDAAEANARMQTIQDYNKPENVRARQLAAREQRAEAVRNGTSPAAASPQVSAAPDQTKYRFKNNLPSNTINVPADAAGSPSPAAPTATAAASKAAPTGKPVSQFGSASMTPDVTAAPGASITNLGLRPASPSGDKPTSSLVADTGRTAPARPKAPVAPVSSSVMRTPAAPAQPAAPARPQSVHDQRVQSIGNFMAQNRGLSKDQAMLAWGKENPTAVTPESMAKVQGRTGQLTAQQKSYSDFLAANPNMDPTSAAREWRSQQTPGTNFSPTEQAGLNAIRNRAQQNWTGVQQGTTVTGGKYQSAGEQEARKAQSLQNTKGPWVNIGGNVYRGNDQINNSLSRDMQSPADRAVQTQRNMTDALWRDKRGLPPADVERQKQQGLQQLQTNASKELAEYEKKYKTPPAQTTPPTPTPTPAQTTSAPKPPPAPKPPAAPATPTVTKTSGAGTHIKNLFEGIKHKLDPEDNDVPVETALGGATGAGIGGAGAIYGNTLAKNTAARMAKAKGIKVTPEQAHEFMRLSALSPKSPLSTKAYALLMNMGKYPKTTIAAPAAVLALVAGIRAHNKNQQ